MNIPSNLEMKTTMHGSGKHGMYVYHMKDTASLGVHLRIHSATRRAAEEHTWWLAALPGQVFDSFEALQKAAIPVTPEQALKEAANWPQIEVTPQAASLDNRCRLCPRDPHTRATNAVRVLASWVPHDSVQYAPLCDFHTLLAQSPASLIAALEEEVESRRQRRGNFIASLQAIAERATP